MSVNTDWEIQAHCPFITNWTENEAIKRGFDWYFVLAILHWIGQYNGNAAFGTVDWGIKSPEMCALLLFRTALLVSRKCAFNHENIDEIRRVLQKVISEQSHWTIHTATIVLYNFNKNLYKFYDLEKLHIKSLTGRNSGKGLSSLYLPGGRSVGLWTIGGLIHNCPWWQSTMKMTTSATAADARPHKSQSIVVR